MAYCLDADIRLHAPQAEPGINLSGYIAQATGVIDATLQSMYDMPLASVPQLLTNCASMLSAGYYLKAHYSKINQNPPEFADQLCSRALTILEDIRSNPSLLGLDLKVPTADDYARNQITTNKTDDPFFTTGDELEWGS